MISFIPALKWSSRSFLILLHCVKSFQIRSYSLSVFSCIWNEYGEILRISLYQSKCGKIRTRNNSVFGLLSRSVTLRFSNITSDWKKPFKLLEYLATWWRVEKVSMENNLKVMTQVKEMPVCNLMLDLYWNIDLNFCDKLKYLWMFLYMISCLNVYNEIYHGLLRFIRSHNYDYPNIQKRATCEREYSEFYLISKANL